MARAAFMSDLPCLSEHRGGPANAFNPDTVPRMAPCLVCAENDTVAFLDADSVPVQCTEMFATREAARAAPVGEMRLVLCRRCSAVTNSVFDPELVPYEGDYENSQLFSGSFRAWASDLAQRLVKDHGLAGSPVVEVGSGKGEFLAMLAEAGAGRATGYDPTYEGEIDHLEGLDVHLVRTMFDSSTVTGDVGLVCSRHVLEHLVDPVEMLSGIRSAVDTSPRCALYVEVPNSAFTFTESGVWDVIYQHCTYFSSVSLEWAARAAGFRVTSVEPSFGGQFLSLEAIADGETGTPEDLKDRADSTAAELARFVPGYGSIIEGWRDRIASWKGSGKRIALWGGGAKGVTFLTLAGQGVDTVIDVNPRKHGRFLPGTGHEVAPAESLAEAGVDVVVIMNGAYESEIRADLKEMGLEPEVAVV